MKKYEWTKPKVTVLVKTNTQEQVLATCKGTASGPVETDGSCMAVVIGCSACNTIAAS